MSYGAHTRSLVGVPSVTMYFKVASPQLCHLEQLLCPANENDPNAQVKQEVAKLELENVPIAHCMQGVAVLGVKLPGLQAMQALAVERE